MIPIDVAKKSRAVLPRSVTLHPIGAPFRIENARLGHPGNAPDRSLFGDRLHDVFSFYELFAALADSHVNNYLVDIDIAHRSHCSIPQVVIAGVCFPTM